MHLYLKRRFKSGNKVLKRLRSCAGTWTVVRVLKLVHCQGLRSSGCRGQVTAPTEDGHPVPHAKLSRLLPNKRNRCETSQANRKLDELNVHPVLATNVTSPLPTQAMCCWRVNYPAKVADAGSQQPRMHQNPARRCSITLIKGASLSATGILSQISERSASAVMMRPARPGTHGGIAGGNLGTRACS